MDCRCLQVAEKFGVSRQTLHTWLAHYEAGGLEGLRDRSKAGPAHQRRTLTTTTSVKDQPKQIRQPSTNSEQGHERFSQFRGNFCAGRHVGFWPRKPLLQTRPHARQNRAEEMIRRAFFAAKTHSSVELGISSPGRCAAYPPGLPPYPVECRSGNAPCSDRGGKV
jgi:transposase-like protein